MKELGQHIMIRTDDDRVLAPSDRQRRALAETIYRIATGFPLLSFGAADNHLHLALLCQRLLAARFVQSLLCALHWALDLPVGFFPVRYKPLADQGHLLSTFHYTLEQRNKHGVQSDPFLDASSLPELLGMRLLPTDSIGRVREHVARLRKEQLLRHLGPTLLEPADRELVRAFVDADRHDLLRDAAAAALGLPALAGRSAPVARSRRTLAKVLAECCSTREVGEIIERTASHTRHLRTLSRQPRLEQALRLQLSLRAWLLEEHPDLVAAMDTQLPGWRSSPALQKG